MDLILMPKGYRVTPHRVYSKTRWNIVTNLPGIQNGVVVGRVLFWPPDGGYRLEDSYHNDMGTYPSLPEALERFLSFIK